MAKTPIVLEDRAVATILHGLRMIQEHANGPSDCMAGCCDHFDEVDEMNDAEIDALCEAINLDSVTVTTDYSPESRTRIGNTPDVGTDDDDATCECGRPASDCAVSIGSDKHGDIDEYLKAGR